MIPDDNQKKIPAENQKNRRSFKISPIRVQEKISSLTELSDEFKKIAKDFRTDKQHELYKRPSAKHQTARIVIPQSQKFQTMEENHDDPLAGHFGKKNTLDRLIRKYYWPNMKKDVDDFVESCPECQKRAPRSGEVHLTPIALPVLLLLGLCAPSPHI